jgi:hypothetical protein
MKGYEYFYCSRFEVRVPSLLLDNRLSPSPPSQNSEVMSEGLMQFWLEQSQ